MLQKSSKDNFEFKTKQAKGTEFEINLKVIFKLDQNSRISSVSGREKRENYY